jgi:hypothetical protein
MARWARPYRLWRDSNRRCYLLIPYCTALHESWARQYLSYIKQAAATDRSENSIDHLVAHRSLCSTSARHKVQDRTVQACNPDAEFGGKTGQILAGRDILRAAFRIYIASAQIQTSNRPILYCRAMFVLLYCMLSQDRQSQDKTIYCSSPRPAAATVKNRSPREPTAWYSHWRSTRSRPRPRSQTLRTSSTGPRVPARVSRAQ